MVMTWWMKQGLTADMLGLLPDMISEDDPRPAKEQFDSNYQHGGGWVAMPRFSFDPSSKAIRYPGDPPMRHIAHTHLRDEWILIYPHAWVCIVQPDGSFEVARMD
jgi:hypothetical protein